VRLQAKFTVIANRIERPVHNNTRKATVKITSAHDLAAAIRSRRLSLGLTQTELAARAGVSRVWLNKLEAGKPTAEFALIIRLLDTLGLGLDLTDRGGDRGPADLDALLKDYEAR
jgi:y4mF family transcriptional regulator